MFDLIREHQLNIMLVLCGACGILTFLLINTRFLSKSRKWILILMEQMAFFLLWFDRLAYIYAGDTSRMGIVMVRVSNAVVFILTSAVVFGFNLYISDWLTHEGKMKEVPRRITVVAFMSVAGMIMALIAAFTDMYYYFDETNHYNRGSGFLLAYIIPVVCPIIQYTVIRQYKKIFSKLIYVSLVLYLFVPIFCGILQIFTYGISIVNMSMVAVSISMYIFMYLDLNNTVERAHEIEIADMQGQQKRMKNLFDQIATAFVSAVEKKDDFTKGNSVRVAEYAKRIAEAAGKSENDCEKIYYAALLHDVGLIGIPDEVIKSFADPAKEDYEVMRQKPVIGGEILSNITEYPYLSQGAYYSHERYNGTGYPEGLEGEEIPEIARIIGVADAFVTMTTRKRYRDAMLAFMAREVFVKGAGEEFDPEFADIMIRIIDEDGREQAVEEVWDSETVITCREYRENISMGIPIKREIKKICFDCEKTADAENAYSEPSIILFDSYDRRTHDEKKAIEGYKYLEYGEVWFNDYSISTAARKIVENRIDDAPESKPDGKVERFEILAGRYEDHLKLVMKSAEYSKEVIVALPGGSKAAYIGITGENCTIRNITIEDMEKEVEYSDIPRIAQPISYIDHLEADIKNIQVDRLRSSYTEGIKLKRSLRLAFHTMTLPGANLVWHCPYVLVYSSDNGNVRGPNYREYAMIKINGENEVSDEFAQNRFVMKRSDAFPGWEKWKKTNKKGMEVRVSIDKKGSQILFKTENLGISIENTTRIYELPETVYVALTGDQVALTDIRIEVNK